MAQDLQTTLPLGRALAILAKSYFGALSKRLEHLGIERYYSILILIDKTEHHCTQQFLCEQLKIDKVSMVRIMDFLLTKDFVCRRQNPEDRRAYFIELTKKSAELLPELYAAIEEVNKAALKGLTKEAQKILYQQITQIQANLDTLPTEKIYINYKKAIKKI